MKKKSIIIIVGIVLFIVIAGMLSYIFLIKPAIDEYTKQVKTEALIYGAQYVMYLIGDAVEKCEPVPIQYGNNTINITAVSCLK